MINAAMIEIEKTGVGLRMATTKARGNMEGGTTGQERATDGETEGAINPGVVEAMIRRAAEPARDNEGVKLPETDPAIDPREVMDEELHRGMLIGDPMIGLETGEVIDRGVVLTIDRVTGVLPKGLLGSRRGIRVGVSPGYTLEEIRLGVIRGKRKAATDRGIKEVVMGRVGQQTAQSRLICSIERFKFQVF